RRRAVSGRAGCPDAAAISERPVREFEHKPASLFGEGQHRRAEVRFIRHRDRRPARILAPPVLAWGGGWHQTTSSDRVTCITSMWCAVKPGGIFLTASQ